MKKEQELVNALHNLKAWGSQYEFNEEDWENYKKTAKIMQKNKSCIVQVFEQFMNETLLLPFSSEEESKLFLLLRIIFDLPELDDVKDFRPFKGWVNWPDYTNENKVNLSWPLRWKDNKPQLIANYEGSMGLPYQALDEYNYFLGKYPFRKIE